jgi:hypothetical protein
VEGRQRRPAGVTDGDGRRPAAGGTGDWGSVGEAESSGEMAAADVERKEDGPSSMMRRLTAVDGPTTISWAAG